MYLFGKKGKKGILQKNEKSKRYSGLMSQEPEKEIRPHQRKIDQRAYYRTIQNSSGTKLSKRKVEKHKKRI